ncbi:uncharacterized protein LOC128200107 [Galleria mellonella]|uniref:Uncharacterized protein LOC128200107 n=1 Tax=Galleria mellonella TaxID=7137 RepID=A0ABM3MAC0_GALME|nr:uncharacterized protein LOC128200107 [Galleria mellonella]
MGFFKKDVTINVKDNKELKQIKRIAQNNYDFKKDYQDLIANEYDSVRIHHIDNPEILDHLLNPVVCRKYDIETEAVKLYGETFRIILTRFRRSPDYLKILNDKTNELREHYNHVTSHILYHYIEQMKKKLEDKYEKGKVKENNDMAADKSKLLCEGANEHEEVTYSPIERLDRYHKLHSSLSVQERNSHMDLGFQYAGHIIHAIIKNLGSDEVSVQSTKLPYGGDSHENKKTTTEHVSVHEVTTKSEEFPLDSPPHL